LFIMLELKSSTVTARFHPMGARISSCLVDGVETVFGSGPDDNVLSGDIYAGAICGRHAGRITNAEYALDGERVKLEANSGPHQLHGGDGGFHARHWDYIRDANRITFTLQSGDGEEGFPGHLDVKAVYALSGSVLSLTLTAETTKPTVCNLTNHAYWNLSGGGSVLGHEVLIPAQQYFPLNDLLLPHGHTAEVAGTRWDFRKARLIAEDYDNAFLLDGARGELKRAVTLRDPASGRTLDVWGTEPVVQMYTAIHWVESMKGRSGPLVASTAFAIEPQNVADAPNHKAFPSSILRPGEIYRNHMEWRFS
jgi:aldose 1-epimerase